ncbi:MAG TPA: YfiR family protein [Puia sp.]|jgi:hypothetical protein|nr:YfiR family protein [Puia sp.]
MKQPVKYAFAAISLVLLTGFGRAGPQEPEIETNLKAAFLYNFTKYIDWQLSPDETTFVIGVVGPSDIDGALKEIARTGTVNNRRIVIRRLDRLDQLGSCQLLFISRRCRFRLADILAKVGKGEITVAEAKNAARNGTGFNFILVGDKLKFEANTKALNSSGLRISSQLLKLAIIVK